MFYGTNPKIAAKIALQIEQETTIIGSVFETKQYTMLTYHDVTIDT